jgi:adenine-specific DNA-methyltransferase
MITYIGNKRKLVNTIEKVVQRLQPQTCADAFSGSGVVSRMLLGHSKKLYVNDLELYCEILSKCFLVTPSWADTDDIVHHIHEMNRCPDKVGFVTDMYASQERQFYTPENGRRIDGMLDYIETHVPGPSETILPWATPGKGEYSYKYVWGLQGVSQRWLGW